MNKIYASIVSAILMLCANYVCAAVTYVHTDHLGSVIAESNSTGQITKRFHYKPFGQTIETQQDDVGYTGHKHDADLNMTYMQARYYDPVLGRFMQPDPIGSSDDFNVYAYVGNDPVNKTDPTGKIAMLTWTASDAVTYEIPYTIDESSARMKDSVSLVEARIVKDFSGTVNINGVNVKVTAQPVAVTGTKAANIIKVVPNTQGVTTSGRAETNGKGDRIIIGANDGAAVVSHELGGHAGGAGDQYAGGVDVNGKTLQSDVSNNNIMHDLGPNGANTQTFKEIINAPSNINICAKGVAAANGGCY